MKISVIIPCHNAGRWISTALQSVAHQTYQPHEIIVIDDGSTDDSMAQIENSGVPVRLLQVNVRNAAVARNAGIEAATGDWLAMLDADDVWYPHHLSRAVELLGETSDVAFMSIHDWISLAGEPVPIPERFVCKWVTSRTRLPVEEFPRLVIEGFHFAHSSVLYQLDRVREVGMFDVTQKRRHDLDLWLRVIAGQTWTYDTVKGNAYRVDTPGSISKEYRECEYYELRALVKNLGNVDYPLYRRHLGRRARAVMGIAFMYGTGDHYRRIGELAWPHLPRIHKFVFACGSYCPRLLRWLIMAYCRITGIRAPGQP